MASLHSSRLGGPIPKFKDYHLWKTLYCLDKESPIGRKKLASLIEIGEGSTRTILNILQENGMISINKSGVALTPEGKECWENCYMDICTIDLPELMIGNCGCAVRVPNAAYRVQYGCEERDNAIKAGARGATTLLCSNNVLMFPGSDYPVDINIVKILGKLFTIKNDDVIIIGSGIDPQSAEIGAVSAGLDLLGGLRMQKELGGLLTQRSTGNELLALAFAIHELVGGLPVCAKSRDNLGIRIESGAVIDNAYNGPVLREVIEAGYTIRKVAMSGPYKGIKVIVTPIELDNRTIAAIGVVDIRSMAGVDNLIRLRNDDDD